MKGVVEMKKEIKDAYKRGANDAWEAAKKIVFPERYGGYSFYEAQKIFGKCSFTDICEDVDCLEAIEKIRQYEERNKFQVGDEVQNSFRVRAVVTCVNGSECASQMYVVFQDGSSGERDKEGWTKTGRHFPQIAEVLKAIDEAMKDE